MLRMMRVGIALLVALGFATPALAAGPDGHSPSSAMPLTATATGSLSGNTGGAYAYYLVKYPGDGSMGTVTLNVSNADPTLANAVGVNLWQDGVLLGTMNGWGSLPGANSLTFSSTTSDPIIAQVYDFAAGTPASYQIALSGIAQPVAALAPTTPARVATAATGSVANPIPLAKPITGTLPGKTGGSFTYFTVPYPGDGSSQTINLWFAPSGDDASNALWINVYQNGSLIGTGQGSLGVAPGQLSVSYFSTTAGPVLVQLANYNAAPISYTIAH